MCKKLEANKIEQKTLSRSFKISITVLYIRSHSNFRDWLQSESKWPLLPNPPSSGFLGLVLAMLHCKTVHIYEFVPSMRLTKRCHYYEEEENIGCTIGEWHPLAAEKLMAISLNVANSTQVYSDGYLVVPGWKSLNCTDYDDLRT